MFSVLIACMHCMHCYYCLLIIYTIYIRSHCHSNRCLFDDSGSRRHPVTLSHSGLSLSSHVLKVMHGICALWFMP